MSAKNLPDAWADDVLHFWFEELSEQDWFRGSQRIDEQCKHRFGELYVTLTDHLPAADQLSPRELLAAVIVFDQFPRNIHRKTPAAYATDGKALSLAKHAVASGKDGALPPRQRHFLYIPFMHSEDLAAQVESVRLFSELGIEAGVKYARHHHDVVARFGRFPHRNAILGRQSTPEELEFLKTEPPLV
ncbi:DUF924 family protein [Steroidobacter sp.]|uniref:DUF924 family protein n=1 Tax=Steroidobacter sp. TaxID=1978227 RepID=UPI001A36F695|nr:DUF924 family protein [Steroidobacter sp.]MBL8267313.1 DUF924 domain-containing protein [Steroidobacter sp.]